MTGLEFGVLRQRLQTRHGFDVHVFSYPSMHGNVDEIVAELADLARERAASTGRVHLVGHSLGGALVYRALELGVRDLPGNAVVLGSPLNGSRAASGVGRISMLRPLIGPHAFHELAEPCGRCWPRVHGRTRRARPRSRRRCRAWTGTRTRARRTRAASASAGAAPRTPARTSTGRERG